MKMKSQKSGRNVNYCRRIFFNDKRQENIGFIVFADLFYQRNSSVLPLISMRNYSTHHLWLEFRLVVLNLKVRSKNIIRSFQQEMIWSSNSFHRESSSMKFQVNYIRPFDQETIDNGFGGLIVYLFPFDFQHLKRKINSSLSSQWTTRKKIRLSRRCEFSFYRDSESSVELSSIGSDFLLFLFNEFALINRLSSRDAFSLCLNRSKRDRKSVV